MWLIAWKSDPVELPKNWFSLNDITKKFAKLLAWFGAYLMTLIALKAAADVNQVAENVNLGVRAITDMKKSSKATEDVNLWNQLWQEVMIDLIIEPLKW